MVKKYKILSPFLFILFFFLLLSVVYPQDDQVEGLIQKLDSNYRELRMSAVWTLGKVSDPRALDALIAALQHKDLGVRIGAAEALGEKKDPKAISPLIDGLKNNEEAVRDVFAQALKEITGKNFGDDHNKWEKWWGQNKKSFINKFKNTQK